MSTSRVTGIVDGVSDYKSKEFFNIALDDAEVNDNWYIGDGTLRDYGDISKGDKVRLHVDDNRGSVTKVDVIGASASEDDASRGQSVRDGPNGSGESSTGSDDFIPKQTRIAVQTAFKEACKDYRELGGNRIAESEKDFKRDQTVEHYEVIQEVMQDVSGGDE